jgi:hypothetical protein
MNLPEQCTQANNKKKGTNKRAASGSNNKKRRGKKAKQVKSADYVVRKLDSETRADEEGNTTTVDWHGVKFDCHDSEIFVCTDPSDGELVCAEYGLSEEERKEHKFNYSSYKDFLDRVLEDHGRFVSVGNNKYIGLCGTEQRVASETGLELVNSRDQNGGSKADEAGFSATRINHEMISSHGSGTMRTLAFLVLTQIFDDETRCVSTHGQGVWIGKINYYIAATGQMHLHRDRATFTSNKNVIHWLDADTEAEGYTPQSVSDKSKLLLLGTSFRGLISVGDTEGQQAGSIWFGIPKNPKTTASNELPFGDGMWAECEDGTACCFEVARKSGDLFVADALLNDLNGQKKFWLNGKLACVYHKPMSAGETGTAPTATVCIDVKATGIDDATNYLIGLCNQVSETAGKGQAPPRSKQQGLFHQAEGVWHNVCWCWR